MEPQIENTEPTAERVTFSAEQQAKVDSLIREKMGVAAREVRAKNVALEAELAALKANPAQVDADALSAKDAEIAAAKAEALSARQQLAKTSMKSEILVETSKYGFIRPDDVLTLTANRIGFDEKLNRSVILGEDGAVLLGTDGTPARIESFFREYAEKNPHMVKGDVRSGLGSKGSDNSFAFESDEAPQNLGKLFGKSSSSKAANDLAMRNPSRYRELRAQAVRLGLVGR